MKVLVVLALAIATVSAGVMPQDVPVHPRDLPAVSSIEGRITNGYNAQEGQFPYQVALAFNSNNGGWFCGGSIIAPNWVLTAAHCSYGASSVYAYFGSTVRTQGKVSHTINSGNFRQHAQYNPNTLANDITLIFTPTLSFTQYINKVQLPSIASSYSTYAGLQAIASGWGKTSDAAGGVTNYLQYQTYTITSQQTCSNYYGTATAGPGVICIATPNQSSTCQGDSGGPLVLASNRLLIGVTSFVSSYGCQVGAPSGFTRTTYYLNWIRDTSGVWYA